VLVAASTDKVASGSFSRLPLKVKLIADLGFLENLIELLSKILHIVAQFHDGNHALNLVVDLRPTEIG
jgi:hypothetical protein